MSAPITNSSIHNNFLDWRKRASTNANYPGSSMLVKRKKNYYYYVLASESSASEDDGTESIDSIQAKETDYAKDTSDTDTKSTDFDMQVEYELPSSSAESANILAASSSSGHENAMIAAGVVAASLVEDDLDIWGTNDDDETDSATSNHDQLINYQVCKSCNLHRTLTCFSLCSHCYQAKKTCYPPRPHRKHPKRKKNQVTRGPAVTKDKLSVCLSGLSQESGLGTSQELQPLAWDQVVVPDNLIQKTPTKCESTTTLMPTSSSTLDMFSQPSSSGIDITKDRSTSPPNCSVSIAKLPVPTLKSWTEAASEMCIMCNDNPKNGIFVHSTGGHLCCCYKCAVKYWSKSKRCAACNCRVINVIKAFII